jgi:DNA-binding transcriptional LysR family regulator
MDRFTAVEAFVSVVDTGSFSAAARMLQVGQPAISKAIAMLEQRLGVRLLLRSTRALAPTEVGKEFYAYAKRIINELERAERAVRAKEERLAGRLRVSACVTFARLHIVPTIGRFLDQHPNISVDLLLDDRNIDLFDERVDVALRMGSLDNSNLTARKLGEAPRLVFGTPAYFELAGEPRTPTELASHRQIVYNQQGGGALTFRHGSSEVSVALSTRLTTTAAEGVREAVFADVGVAVASEWMFAPELKSGKVKAVLTDWQLPTVGLWAVFPAGRLVSAKGRAFVSFVEEILAGAGPS